MDKVQSQISLFAIFIAFPSSYQVLWLLFMALTPQVERAQCINRRAVSKSISEDDFAH